MKRGLLLALVSGCSNLLEADPGLLPPPPDPEGAPSVERIDPGSFDPCPSLQMDPPLPLSSSAFGTGNPRIAWNEEVGQFAVVWLEGDRVAYRFLDREGHRVGLGEMAEGTADADPDVVAVSGLGTPGYVVTMKVGSEVVARPVLAADLPPPQEVTILSQALPGDTRASPLAWNGRNLAIGYQLDNQYARLVAFNVSLGELRCEQDLAGECPGDVRSEGDGPAVGSLDGRWLLVTALEDRLSWAALDDGQVPPRDQGPIGVIATGPIGLRMASNNRRLAFAVLVETWQGPRAQIWQVDNDLRLSMVFEADELWDQGTPAVALGYGGRLAVVGVWPRPGGARDIVLLPADVTQTPAQQPALQVTYGGDVVASHPALAFSGGGFGIVWAQGSLADPEHKEVYFALARCAQ